MSKQFAPGGPYDTRDNFFIERELGKEFVFDKNSIRNVLLGETQLSKDEAFALAEFIDSNLIDYFRNDSDTDMYWLRNMIHAYEKLCVYGGYVGLTEPSKKEDE